MSTALKETSANRLNRRVLGRACVLNEALARMALRWKMQILYEIHLGRRSFAALKKTLPTVSDHVLARRLRELVSEGLALRKQSVRGKTRAHYATTQRGEDLLRICAALCAWAGPATLPALDDDVTQAGAARDSAVSLAHGAGADR